MRRSEELDLEKRALRGRDLVVFSNDWDGDPLSKTHIMRLLARENRILWVNSIGNRAPKANAHDVKRLWKKLSTFTQGLKEVEPNLFVLAPLAIPLYGAKAVRAANKVLLRAQVKRAMRTLGFRRPLSWSFLPASAPVSGTLGEELVVYHCVDEFSAFNDTNGRSAGRSCPHRRRSPGRWARSWSSTTVWMSSPPSTTPTACRSPRWNACCSNGLIW
jgi:hypothetical protein